MTLVIWGPRRVSIPGRLPIPGLALSTRLDDGLELCPFRAATRAGQNAIKIQMTGRFILGFG